jgi:membrane protein required for colicin V production
MNLFDAALLLVALISVLAGALRGFVKEAAALAGWVVAVLLVLRFAVGIGQRLPFDPGSTGVRTAIAAILIVLVCILVASLAGRILHAAMTAARLGGPDRALGALFGLARAAAVWLLVAVVVVHVGLAQRPFWKSSRVAPWLVAALRWVAPNLAPGADRPLVASGV